MPDAAVADETTVAGELTPATQQVPTRLVRGPVEVLPHRLAPADRPAWLAFQRERLGAGSVQAVVALYWADGQRTLAEIDRLVRLETGTSDLEAIMTYFDFLEKAGFITLTP